MSLKVMKAVFDSHLERRLRFLAIALAWYADDDGGRVFPSAAKLADMLGVEQRQVRKGLKQLRKHRVLSVLSRATIGDDGVQRPIGKAGRATEYAINLDILQAFRPSRRNASRNALV